MSDERPDHAELFRDGAGEWRSRVVAANGETVFDSAEGYQRWQDCERIITSRFPGIEVRFLDGEA